MLIYVRDLIRRNSQGAAAPKSQLHCRFWPYSIFSGAHSGIGDQLWHKQVPRRPLLCAFGPNVFGYKVIAFYCLLLLLLLHVVAVLLLVVVVIVVAACSCSHNLCVAV